MKFLNVTYEECRTAACMLATELQQRFGYGRVRVWGVPRGGVGAALILAASTHGIRLAETPQEADVAVDDIIDSGRTAQRVAQMYNLPTAALFRRSTFNGKIGDRKDLQPMHGKIINGPEFLVFPWEHKLDGGDDSAEDAVVRMLQVIDPNPEREGLHETPKRVVKAWKTWFRGYNEDPKDYLKAFDDGAEGCNEMVMLTNIPVYSHCEHHITPFIGVAHVAYIPNGKIVGISKLARIVDTYARRLQVQERLTNQIADCIVEHLNPLGAAVVVTAKHMCMVTRGVQTPNVDTTTSAMRGVFFENLNTRQEFLRLALAAQSK